MTVIRFKIGDGFPAHDPVARFITGPGMSSKRALDDMLGLEGDTPEELGRRVSLFRRQTAAVQQAATFIDDARRMFSEVSGFINGLDEGARAGREHVVGAVDIQSPHYLGKWLDEHRNLTHHYPKLHPAAAQHDEEERQTPLPRRGTLRARSTAARSSAVYDFASLTKSASNFYPRSRTRAGWKSFANTSGGGTLA